MIGVITIITTACLGLATGSFFNALEYRIKHKKNIITDRSRCVHCNHVLSWRDLFPVLSFILLKGKCRYCNKPISVQYPVVELGTASLFVIATLTSLPTEDISHVLEVYQLYFIALGKGIVLSLFFFFSIYDGKHRIVPNKLVLPLIIIFSVLAGIQILLELASTASSLFIFSASALNRLIAGSIGFLFFLTLILVTNGKAMGGGDSKYAALIGLILGVKALTVALYIAFITGAIYGIVIGIKRGRIRGQKLPFIPFLSLGSGVAFLYGDYIFNLLFPDIELYFRFLL